MFYRDAQFRKRAVQSRSECQWRTSSVSIAESLFAEALRTGDCDLNEYQRFLLSAALSYVEKRTKTALQARVQEVRLSRFPWDQGAILLDYRNAWTPAIWTTFDTKAQATGAPGWMVSAKSSIESLFGTDTPPLRINYGDCCNTSTETTLDPTGYELRRSEHGDRIVLKDKCSWPYLNCGGDNRYPVRISYVAGFIGSFEFQEKRPDLMQQVLMAATYLHEGPEQVVQGVPSAVIERVLSPLMRPSMWTV